MRDLRHFGGGGGGAGLQTISWGLGRFEDIISILRMVQEVRPRGALGHTQALRPLVCSPKGISRGRVPRPWADSTGAEGKPPPHSPVEGASSLVFSVLCRRPRSGGGGCRWESLERQAGGSSPPPGTHPGPLLFRYPNLFRGVFSKEET